MNSGQFRSCSLPSSDSKYGGCTKIFEDDDVRALLAQFQYNLLYNDSLALSPKMEITHFPKTDKIKQD